MPDNEKITSRSRWRFTQNFDIDNEYSFEELVNYYISNMLNKTLVMFEWKNLPDGMNSYDVEKFCQLKGQTFILFDEVKKRYFILEGSPYDNISWNFEPTKAIIVNPSLPEISGIRYELGKNAVMIRNDYLMLGLYQILEKNAMDVSNTDISIRYAQFNTRFKTLFTSDDDPTADSLNDLIKSIWKGEKPKAIVTNDLYKKSIEGIKYADSNSSSDIMQLIELKQYQLAQWYIELCINANYNMKREAINENEANMNEDALLPLIDQMLNCRQMAVKEMNSLFGLNIEVDLSSSWKKIRKEVDETIKNEELQNESLEAEVKNLEEQHKEEASEEPIEEKEVIEDEEIKA